MTKNLSGLEFYEKYCANCELVTDRDEKIKEQEKFIDVLLGISIVLFIFLLAIAI